MEGQAQLLREQFERELAAVVEPMPRPGLVARQAVEQGRRLHRRRQMLASGTWLTVTAGIAVLGWVVVGNAPVTANGDSTRIAAAGSPSEATSSVAASRVPTLEFSTAQKDVASALTRALDAAGVTGKVTTTTFPAAEVLKGAPVVRVEVTGPAGSSMAQLAVGSNLGDLGSTTGKQTVGPGGQEFVIDHADGNCIQDLVVQTRTSDGLDLRLDAGSCMSWNGTTNPPATAQLTNSQAMTVLADASVQQAGAQALAAAVASGNGQ